MGRQDLLPHSRCAARPWQKPISAAAGDRAVDEERTVHTGDDRRNIETPRASCRSSDPAQKDVIKSAAAIDSTIELEEPWPSANTGLAKPAVHLYTSHPQEMDERRCSSGGEVRAQTAARPTIIGYHGARSPKCGCQERTSLFVVRRSRTRQPARSRRPGCASNFRDHVLPAA